MFKSGWASALGVCVWIIAAAPPLAARASVDLINDQGATAPCIGMGPIGGPAADYCGQLFVDNGFLRVVDLGATGLVFGVGDKDGVVTAVAPGSAGEKAGVRIGDVITEVDERPIRASPGAFAQQHLFGLREEPAKLRLRREGVTVDLVVPRTPAAFGLAPRSTNVLVAIKPLVDWRGKFIPCVGIGPLGFAAVGFCNSHFKPFGYVPIHDAGSVGVDLDLTLADKAVVKTLDAEGRANGLLRQGDEILAVDGVQVVGSRTAVLNAALFGRVGEQKRLVAKRGDATFAATMLLAQKQKR